MSIHTATPEQMAATVRAGTAALHRWSTAATAGPWIPVADRIYPASDTALTGRPIAVVRRPQDADLAAAARNHLDAAAAAAVALVDLVESWTHPPTCRPGRCGCDVDARRANVLAHLAAMYPTL